MNFMNTLAIKRIPRQSGSSQGSAFSLLRFLLATVFLWAGAYKLSSLDRFLYTLSSYSFLPGGLRWILHFWIPGVELLIGFAFLVGAGLLEASIISSLLLTLFTIISLFDLAMGKTTGCGCFSGTSESWWSHGLGLVARNGMLLAGSAIYSTRQMNVMKQWERNSSEVNPTSGPEATAAFTLVELLITIVTIGILSSLMLASLSSAKEITRRSRCLGNLRQLTVASTLYADDDRSGNLSPSVSKQDVDLNHLTASGLRALGLFVCPSTRNSVRASEVRENRFRPSSGLTDLIDPAPNRFETFGMSYSLYGFMGVPSVIEDAGGPRTVPWTKKTLASVNSYVHHHDTLGLQGQVVGPSRIWLLLDDNFSDRRAFPDKSDNHGSAGGNVAYCDGHVKWVSSAKYVSAYETSQDSGRTNINIIEQ